MMTESNEFSRLEQLTMERRLRCLRIDTAASRTGWEVGRTWAINEGTPESIARVIALTGLSLDSTDRDHNPSQRIVMAIEGKKVMSRYDSNQFWQAHGIDPSRLYSHPHDSEFATKFAEAVEAVWRLVRSRVDLEDVVTEVMSYADDQGVRSWLFKK